MNEQQLFEALLRAEDEGDVDSILKKAGYGLENEEAWRPLGDMENNFSTVGNQQTEATGALVEKVINGIDAVLMAECFKHGADPQGAAAPATMSEAVQRFFDVRNGQLAEIGSKAQTELAKNIHLIAVGEKTSPSYLVIDRGEGQTPEAFPDTFLSLNRSNKLRIPFVQGKFNAGGTGVLQFCGQQNMQLIVSRRHPNAPVRSGDNSKDLWGFTIVRRLRPSDGRRSSMYVYLAPNKKVPRFAANEIAVLPEERSSILPRPYMTGITHGTCVKLYNFKWKGRGIATLEARYELERFLHSPCLPFRLTETRDYKANYFSTTVAGVWATVGAASSEDSKVEPGFPASADLRLLEVGHLPYRIAVFQDTINYRHVPHGVFFTVNGQVHGSLPSDFVARTLKFDYLKDHLLVSVDCTSMDAQVREDFFLASRDRVRKNDTYEEIVEKLKEALRDHPGLRELNAARRKKQIDEAISDDKETTNLFNELLKADPLLATLFGVGDRLITSTGPGASPPFVGRKFPSYFRLTKSPAGGLEKHCPVNRTSCVEFETDATNDYFTRIDSSGTITTDPPNIVEHSRLWNGRFTMNVRVPWNAKPGDRFPVVVTVEDIEVQARGRPFVSKFVVIAEKEADPPTGGGRSNGSRRNPQNSTKKAPGLAPPEVHEVEREDPNISLEVKHDEAGNPEFFVNLRNTYLVNELVRAKTEDHALVKFWFKYGLALCALGMMQEQKRLAEGKEEPTEDDAEEGEEAQDDLKRINSACNGLARVIIPIVRVLYRGPLGLAS